MSFVASELLESIVSAPDPSIVSLLISIGIDVYIKSDTTTKSAWQMLDRIFNLVRLMRLAGCTFAFPVVDLPMGDVGVIIRSASPCVGIIRVVGAAT